MKQNKWLKWIVGIGGISTFTLFLQTIEATNQSDSAGDYAVNHSLKVLNQERTPLATKTELREQQLMTLDWSEADWDVEFTNDVIIAIPRAEQSTNKVSNNIPQTKQPVKSPVEDRTRRS